MLPKVFIAIASLASLTQAATTTTTNPYATYPSVAKTASINGFADPMISAGAPACAKPCLGQSTGVTPCPYWDTGCLCVIPAFANAVADCVAKSCKGSDVKLVTSLAQSVCSKAGVPNPYWLINAAASSELASAATATAAAKREEVVGVRRARTHIVPQATGN